jgi:hypothetical protein
MIAGHILSPPLESALRTKRTGSVTSNPDDVPVPPCPVCGTPLHVEWIDISTLRERNSFIPGLMMCPSSKYHDTRGASVELSWPHDLTDEDRAWLRQQNRLTGEAS